MLNFISMYAVPLTLLFIPLYALARGVPLYERFVEGAAEGMSLILKILPYILAMMTAVAVFRASGAFEAISRLLAPVCGLLGLPVEVLPLALLRPLSGSGALGVTADIMQNQGPDSFSGRLASVMQGSTDTTFYILAIYFGSVGIKKYRYALTVGLLADMASFIAAFCVCKLMF
ncbi:MAG: spore maturation protein [Clostridiales bacterium]|nr:spore maturation protein [Clostridiales bacterium]